jgi:hypothetical protein
VGTKFSALVLTGPASTQTPAQSFLAVKRLGSGADHPPTPRLKKSIVIPVLSFCVIEACSRVTFNIYHFSENVGYQNLRGKKGFL